MKDEDINKIEDYVTDMMNLSNLLQGYCERYIDDIPSFEAMHYLIEIQKDKTEKIKELIF